MRGSILLVAVAIVVSGCAESPSTPEPVADDPVAAGEAGEAYANDDRICERVRRTGTHRSQIICRTRAEIERESDEGKDTFDSLRNSQINTSEYGRASDGRQ